MSRKQYEQTTEKQDKEKRERIKIKNDQTVFKIAQ